MTTVLVAIITTIVAPLITLYAKDWVENRRKKSKESAMETSVPQYMQIGEEIEKLLSKSKAQRVWMLQFHNGGNFYPTGKSIQKFSIFYESLQTTSVPPILHLYQNIPVSIFFRAFMRAQEVGEIFIPDRDDEKVATYGLKYAMEQSGAKSAYLFKVETAEGKFAGAIGVDYLEKTDLSEEQLDAIRREVYVIGGLLSAYLKA